MNMKNKGFIYIISVFLILFIAICVYFSISFIENYVLINKNKKDYLQGQLYAESLINYYMWDEKFLSDVKNLLYSTNSQKNIQISNDFFESTNNRLILKINNDNSFNLKSFCEYKSNKYSNNCNFMAINYLYTIKTGVLNSSKIKNDDLKKLKDELFDNIKKYPKIIRLQGEYEIKNNSLYEISYIEDEDGEIIKLDKFIKNINADELYYLEMGNLKVIDSCFTNFILDAKADMLGKVHGLIILDKNAEIYLNKIPRGYIIDIYDNLSVSKIEYYFSYLKNFDKYLPDFFKIRVKNLKN